MRNFPKGLLVAVATLTALVAGAQNYVPSKDNLLAREEFSRERFGIFLHWGIYATFAQGEWYLNNDNLDKDEYAKAADGFYPVHFDAKEWARAFKDSGAEYVTITSRHHDGFSMYDTEASDYDIVDRTPYGKDVLKALDEACLDEGLRFQFYYSILDWTREDYPVGRTGTGTGRSGDKADYDHYFSFMKAQVRELLTKYHTRALWFDGYWDHSQDAVPFDWRMEEFYSYIHSIQPSCLVGNNHHRLPIDGEDYVMFEKDLPGRNTTGFSEGQEIVDYMPMEMCETMNSHWGYSVKDQNYKTVDELVRLLATCVSMNSNLLLNIGPQADGRLPALALDRLKGIGEWMRLNGASIKGCGPGPLPEQPWGVTTAPVDDSKTVYIHVFKRPGGDIELPLPKKARIQGVTALADGAPILFKKNKDLLSISLPADMPEGSDYVVKVSLR